MDITSREEDGVRVATVTGDIDGKTAPQAQAALLPLLSDRAELVLDMSGVGFMSSAGLRTMLLLYRQASAKKGRVVLVGLSEEIKDTMQMTGFLNFFTLSDSVSSGVKAVTEGRKA